MTILIAQPERQEAVQIPDEVGDLATFRRWVRSDDFPDSGQYAHLNGSFWVDGTMENRRHNQIKTEFTVTLGGLVRLEQRGEFYADGIWLTNEQAAFSIKPDAMYGSIESLGSGKLTFAEWDSHEAIGSPDMVLEIVSPSSRTKDTVILRDLYHRSKISEYWLVEPARAGDTVEFQILQWTAQGYVAAENRDGWIESAVFGKAFRLTSDMGPLGTPQFHLLAR